MGRKSTSRRIATAPGSVEHVLLLMQWLESTHNNRWKDSYGNRLWFWKDRGTYPHLVLDELFFLSWSSTTQTACGSWVVAIIPSFPIIPSECRWAGIEISRRSGETHLVCLDGYNPITEKDADPIESPFKEFCDELVIPTVGGKWISKAEAETCEPDGEQRTDGRPSEPDLVTFACGTWADTFEVLGGRLSKFAKRHQGKEFGRFRFTIVPHPLYEEGELKRRWMVRMYDKDRELGRVDDPNFEGWPYGEVEACRIVEKLKVRLLYMDVYADAIKGYLKRLHEALVEDGLQVKPIGELAEVGPLEAQAETGEADREGLPNWFPKTKKTRKKWKECYDILKKAQKDYKAAYDNLETENPQPTIDDYRDKLASEKNWKPSGKTVSHILKAGKDGLLK